MAEYVDFRIEELIPFFEELKRTKLYNPSEIKRFVDRIRDFEYKLERRGSKLNDFLEYIRFEKMILKDIKQRRKEKHFNHKKEEIERKLITQIHSQFGVAKKLFSLDLEYWEAYVKFLRQLKSWTAVSAMYRSMLLLIGKKYPHIYKNASNFEFEHNPKVGIEAARQCYREGFRTHPQNMDLIVDAFTLELKYAEYLSSNPDVMKEMETHNKGGESMKELKLAKLLYRGATKTQTQVKLFLNFYFAAQHYNLAESLQQEIIDDIMQRCGTNEETYNCLAKLALQNHDVPRCIQQYHIAIQRKPTEKMYDYFLQTLGMLSRKSKKYREMFLQTCEQAHHDCKLSAEGYSHWACFIENMGSNTDVNCSRRVKEVLQLGLQRFECVGEREKIWCLNVELIRLMLKEDFKCSDMLDKLSVVNNSQISETVWKQVFFSFVVKGFKNSNIEKLVEMVKNDDVKRKLRVLLLEHLGYQNVQTAREYYQKYYGIPPYSYDFHKTMIDIEQSHMDQSTTVTSARQHFQNAILQFGDNLPEVWIHLIKFEKNVVRDQQRATMWYEAAPKTLRTETHRQVFFKAAMQI